MELTPNNLLILAVLYNSARRQVVGRRNLAQAALRESDARRRPGQTIFHFVRAIGTLPDGLVFVSKAGSRKVYALSAFGVDVLQGLAPVWVRRGGAYAGMQEHVFVEDNEDGQVRWTLVGLRD